MTKEQSDFVKRNWLNFANIVTIISAVWYMSAWKTTVESRLEMVEQHITDKDQHLPYADKVKLFVPRTELEIHFQNIYETMNEIKSDVKSIERQVTK